MSDKPINVLFVNGGLLNRGGIESFMINYYRNIDKKKVHIDFLVHGYGKGKYDDEILSNGSDILHVPTKSKHPFLYVKTLKKIFSSGKYKIVHSNVDAMSCWILKIAKECKVPVRIAHSHNTDHLTDNKIKYFINELARKKICKYTTNCFACSNAAGKWLFNNHNFQVIPNAIDLDKFKFSKKERSIIRKKLNIANDEMLIGHVGRFDSQKNQIFLLEIFNELNKKNKKCKLLLIGDGDKKRNIEKYVRYNGLNDKVIFLGNRKDVWKFYSAMDIFLLPSLFEGLPVVLIEAQINGLKIISSNNVPEEANMVSENRMQFLPLEHKAWINQILKINTMEHYLDEKSKICTEYNIKIASKKLQDFYMEVYREV